MKLNAYARFFEKLYINDETGCWEYVSEKNDNSYHSFSDEDGKNVMAHRWAYTAFTGKQIPEGMEIGHICPKGSRRDCMNPKHLKPMTRAQNMAYMAKEGRGKKKKSRYLMMTVPEYNQIMDSYEKGQSAYSIAKRLNRDSTYVRGLIRGTIKLKEKAPSFDGLGPFPAVGNRKAPKRPKEPAPDVSDITYESLLQEAA
jgi:hypothetical protein